MDGRQRRDDAPERPQRDAVFAPAALTADHPSLGRWAFLIAIGLVLVVVKPWDWGDVAQPQGSAGAVFPASDVPIVDRVPASPDPSASPSIDAEIAALCLDRGRWLITTVETYGDQTIQVWSALDPATEATGPDDPSIPVTPGVSEGILELGWCAPTVGDERPIGDVAVEAWRLTEDEPKSLSMVRSQPSGVESPFGALYLAPRGGLRPPRASAPWPDATYVFHLSIGGGRERWFAIEIARRDPIASRGPSAP